jgi:predicted glycoside hydrolase/deacetylase ChbG (UPF0249 family)
MAKRIILNADDFGPSESLNQGIYEGIKAGIVSSVSVFVTFGETNFDNIRKLKKFIDSDEVKHHVGIGLHFTITAGSPVNMDDYNSLTLNNGMFNTFDKFKWRVSLNEFEYEMDSQINKLAELLGGKDQIDHINCHVGICFLNKDFWNILISKGYPVRTPIKFSKKHISYDDRIPFTPVTRIGLGRIFTSWSTLRNGRQKFKYIIKNNRHSVRVNRHNQALYEGVTLAGCCLFGYYKQASVIALHNVVKQLELSEDPNESIEIMLHLSSANYPDDRFDFHGIEGSSFVGRKNELEMLIKSNIIQLMKEKGVEQISYRQL